MRLRECLILLAFVPFLWNGGDNKTKPKAPSDQKEERYTLDRERLLETLKPRFAKLPANAQPMIKRMIASIQKMRVKLTLRFSPKKVAILESKAVNPFTEKPKSKTDEMEWKIDGAHLVIGPPKDKRGKKTLFCLREGEHLNCKDAKGIPQLYFRRRKK
ncbi:hypothetical protein L6R29_24160 [Myxococcota bacterium]|nr:hypothetical protein [Myxococcota bacterium]